MLIRLRLVGALAMLMSLVTAVATEVQSIDLTLRYKQSFSDGHSHSSMSSVVITSLPLGEEQTFGDRFPKLLVLALEDPRRGEILQMRLVAADGSIIDSIHVFLTSDGAAEFSLGGEDPAVTGTISRR